ncbi:hypothetical protein PHLCEN_2v7624 [Hermanssonia centrifuga]|uniref:Uncharacterized protein n=1 Tax=Hermanssonia centrifuga TaxID=98765 RepID=A0A2R6NW12_9APHY|nr:hypothetical protein PHLCEN_2v7624 [Hermanssonia centrifuga]
MGAAIPHLIQLATSLPGILPYAPEEIQTEVLTGTVEVQDEVIPEDEDEDISYRSRGKSTISVVIKIGDGVDEGARTGKGRNNWRNGVAPASGGDSRNNRQGRKQNQAPKDKPRGSEEKRTAEPERIVIREEDMENE